MTIPDRTLELSIEEKLTWGEMIIMSDDPSIDNFTRLAHLRKFLIDRSNWTQQEIDQIRDGEETTVVMNQIMKALQAASVPKGKKTPSRTGRASKRNQRSPNGQMTLSTEKRSTSSLT